MNIGDWITLAAVIVALAMGIISIYQTMNLEKKRYKNSLLDNISKWAQDISNVVPEYSRYPIDVGEIAFSQNVMVRNQVAATIDYTNRVKWFTRYKSLATESKSMKEISALFKGKEFNLVVNTTIEYLNKHLEVLKREIETRNIPDSKYDESNKNLLNNTEQLEEFISKFRIEIISGE